MIFKRFKRIGILPPRKYWCKVCEKDLKSYRTIYDSQKRVLYYPIHCHGKRFLFYKGYHNEIKK